MFTTERAEKYRSPHPVGLHQEKGDPYGWFEIRRKPTEPVLRIQVAPGYQGWEHASVSRGDRCPTWEEMCFVKDLFWDSEDVVMQFHPKKSEYVNLAKTCLHLWRPIGIEFPTPDKLMVGI